MSIYKIVIQYDVKNKSTESDIYQVGGTIKPAEANAKPANSIAMAE